MINEKIDKGVFIWDDIILDGLLYELFESAVMRLNEGFWSK